MLTVLLPCKDQLPAYLSAAVDSVLLQDDPNWELLVVFHPDTPAELPRVLPADARVRWFRCPRPGLAGRSTGEWRRPAASS